VIAKFLVDIFLYCLLYTLRSVLGCAKSFKVVLFIFSAVKYCFEIYCSHIHQIKVGYEKFTVVKVHFYQR